MNYFVRELSELEYSPQAKKTDPHRPSWTTFTWSLEKLCLGTLLFCYHSSLISHLPSEAVNTCGRIALQS